LFYTLTFVDKADVFLGRKLLAGISFLFWADLSLMCGHLVVLIPAVQVDRLVLWSWATLTIF
jgi:hypothetical protein